MQKRLHHRLVQSERHADQTQVVLGPDPSLEFLLLWRHKTQHPPSRI